MQTGENEQGLRKILDLTRMMSIAILLLHFYYYCYGAFKQWEIRSDITDRLLQIFTTLVCFSSFDKSKLIALIVLVISLFGARGRKDEKLGLKSAFAYILTGLILYFISVLILKLEMGVRAGAISYIGITAIGFVLMLTGGTLFSRIIYGKLNNNVFNSLNETSRRKNDY
jgi:hypothetical protein